ncbi:hypothetical protein MASR1M46_12070 [Bacteroidales bacterium]
MIYIGIDLGGTKISSALFHENNSILLRETVLLEGKGSEEVGKLICDVCNLILQKSDFSQGDEISIGVCVPGISYSKSGHVWCPNIPGWDYYPLKKEISLKFPDSKLQ